MFPAKTLEDAIRDEIAAAIDDRPIPRGSWEPVVDSLLVVRVILRVEEELAIELPDTVMPAGGFDGVDHCVETIMRKCRELWNANQTAKEEA